MEEKNKKVTVIVPVHDAQEYLDEMLQSVLNQSYREMEVLLIENGSGDQSLQLCRRWEQKDDRIRVYQEEICGIGKARNRGMREAQGEYLCFVDADDYFSDLHILDKMIRILEQTGADLAVCNYVRLWKERLLPAAGHEHFSILRPDSEDFRFHGFFSVGTLAYVWGKVYRKSFLTDHEIHFSDLEYGEDKVFNMQCYVCGARYAFLEDRGYVYRNNEQSVMHNQNVHSGWLDAAHYFNAWTNDWAGKDQDRQKQSEYCRELIAYLIFFGAFFDAKESEKAGHRGRWAVHRMLKCYGRDELGHSCFLSLRRGVQSKMLSQRMWKWMLFAFSAGMSFHLYAVLALGIRFLIRHRVDEQLSDTGLREAQ